MDTLTFPEPRDELRLVVSSPSSLSLALKPAVSSDLSFLRDLYASSRATELAFLPWPDDAKTWFCNNQFDLQHQHYVGNFQPADFYIVLANGKPAGRLYLHHSQHALHIIDILLEDHHRRQGIGTALLAALQAATSLQALQELSLHVELHNSRARALYERLGFVTGQIANGTHVRMTWTPH